MHRAGWDAPDGYGLDALNDRELLSGNSEKGASLRAMIASLSGPADPYAVLRNGPIPGGEAKVFDDLYRRGREELREWVRAGGPPTLQRLVAEA
jgi:hypothetical protein